MSTPLTLLREQMKQHQISACLVPSSDYHGSEYVGAHFAARAFLSGFTGSAGTLLVLLEEAFLWTDGRYFIQAERELSGSAIQLMRQGETGVLSLEAVLQKHLTEGDCLAFDGRCVSAQRRTALGKLLSPRGVSIRSDLDLVSLIWKERPPLSVHGAFLLNNRYAGESRAEKLVRVRKAMKEAGANHFLLTSLEDIGWLLNLRGGDIDCTPVLLSYLAVTETAALLFANPFAISLSIAEELRRDGITLCPYEAFYDHIGTIEPKARVLMDRSRVNCLVEERLSSKVTVIDRPSPTEGFKAVKNETEIRQMKAAHLKDGVALTRFLFWLKEVVGKETVTELTAAARLEDFRREQEHYLGPSFTPILAYGPHGAIVHYAPDEESSSALAPQGFLLADTGGHYLEGSTDCTRTIALGPLTQEQKAHYTAVLRGNLSLASAQFLKGCTGVNLDYLARGPLWSMGLDYNHGTGHGVGYLLSVHEGPNRIHWRSLGKDAVLEPGMITSNEPGVYLEGQYGIRLENLLLCVKREENQYGTFLGFEDLTLAPFDLDAVEERQLSQEDKDRLNRYHQRVREALFPYLNDQETAWLKDATRSI